MAQIEYLDKSTRAIALFKKSNRGSIDNILTEFISHIYMTITICIRWLDLLTTKPFLFSNVVSSVLTKSDTDVQHQQLFRRVARRLAVVLTECATRDGGYVTAKQKCAILTRQIKN